MAKSISRSVVFCSLTLVLYSLAIQPATAHSRDSQPQLESEAEQGNPVAQYKLGYMFATGEGRPRDAMKAMEWLQKSAAQGNADAEGRLGVMYRTGQAGPPNPQEGFKWFYKAAEQGNLYAEEQVSDMYLHGEGVPENRDEAQKWLARAKAQIPPNPNDRTFDIELIELAIALAMFAFAMVQLQDEHPSRTKKLVFYPIVHVIGPMLVANSFITYGFEIFGCTGMPSSCPQYGKSAHFLGKLGDWQIMNLIWRFMGIIGFGLDALAVWYLVYLRRIFRRTPDAAP